MKPLRWQMLATQVPAGGRLGGVVRYTTELMRALAARDDVLVSAVAVRSAADTMRELLGGGEVRVVPDAPTPVLSLAERYAPMLSNSGGADVVQGTKHLVPRRSTALRVLTVHDMLLLDRPRDFGAGKRLLLPGPYRASIGDADLVLAVSRATRERIQAHVPGAAARTSVVHLATSSSLLGASSSVVGRVQHARFALVVGDPTPRKNLRTLIEGWAAVRAQVPDAVLAIAGPPSWGRTELGDTFAELAAAGAVVTLGHVDDTSLRWLYEHAQVVLCPSLAEGFGLPAAEALDFDAPVVISDDPALVEVCAGRARAVLPALDRDAWVRASVAAMSGDARRPSDGARPGARTWEDVAEESVAAARDALARRA